MELVRVGKLEGERGVCRRARPADVDLRAGVPVDGGLQGQGRSQGSQDKGGEETATA